MPVSHWTLSLRRLQPPVKVPKVGSVEASEARDIVKPLQRAKLTKAPEVGMKLGLALHVTNHSICFVSAARVILARLRKIDSQSLEANGLRKPDERVCAARRVLVTLIYPVGEEL
jgi:hypothetical protein